MPSALGRGESGHRLLTTALTSRHTEKWTRKTEYDICPNHTSGPKPRQACTRAERKAITNASAVNTASAIRPRKSSARPTPPSTAMASNHPRGSRARTAQQAIMPSPYEPRK